ncbi:ParB/RepB/Spo0J family partition protein [Roseitalea porphyridii]|uniref:ParB/RepB/Spo0J family partition protein n=1 Tax=Roseitalea porphyridii TaxID=1852022 RepID=A0A4P6UVK2_9HYPH|nr:ParB/RepB/Spo0J family partition protein [Roseitalea porphyridii]QBK29257.1 ParB/RepB/Spo0J family partition protein [Roseitalea porphyridii]
MADDRSGRRLGRGLAALIGEMDQPVAASQPTVAGDRTMPIEWIVRSPNNPRRAFDEADLDDLARSMRDHGVIQPIVVRPRQDGQTHEIIAGERRWRAAQRAGLAEVPVIVRAVGDKAALELAIVENVQRSDLNPIEEALGYQQLMEDHGYGQAELGDVIGKSRSHVANTLRLLKLPESVRAMVSAGELSAGHARTLVTADDPEALARRIVREGLSVRQAEALAQEPTTTKGGDAPKKAGKDPDTRAIERTLSDSTGYKVDIRPKGEGGELRIRYHSLEQFDDLCRLLQRQ